MAITLDAVALVSISVTDRDLNTRQFSFPVSSGETFADIQTFVTGSVIPAVDALVNGIVTGYSVNFSADDVVVVNTDADEASDVERKGVFQFIAANKAISKIEIPSIDNAFVIDGTNLLNLQAPEVQALRDLWVPTGTPAVQPVTMTGSSFVNLYDIPHKIHRKSSKG